MAGPQRARLDTALTGALEHVVDEHSREWTNCVRTMTMIASALRNASPEVKERIGGETGPAIDKAFAKSAQGMQAKGQELMRGSGALQAASDVIRQARQEKTALDGDTRQPPGEYQKPVGQPTEADLQKEAANKQAHAAYDAWYADQERRAQIQADRMDQVFGRSTQVMKDIHGMPDPEPPTGGPGGGSGGPGGGSAPGPASSPGAAGGGGPRSPQPPTPYDPPGPNGGKPGPGYVPGPGGGSIPVPAGSGPQGGSGLPIDYTPGGAGTVGSPGSGGLSGSTGVGVAGAAAGGLGGGLLASGLAAGGLRPGAVTQIAASPGTAASGVRGIGATGRTGVSGALGGKPGVSTVSPGGGTSMANRAASSRAGASRGSGSAAGRGGRSAGVGGGGTAAGRAGNRKDDDKRRKRDLFDASEDWVDDEDAAPSVID